jgi:CRISPR-associated protein Cmr3
VTSAVYAIEPFDTTAFRDGRPFEQDDQGLSEAVSVFPPPPPAITGAVMVALARSVGADPKLDWRLQARDLASSSDAGERSRAADLAAILDAPTAGPFIARWDGGDGWDLFSRCPADLLFQRPSDDAPAPVGRIKPTRDTQRVNIVGTQLDAAKLFREDRSGNPMPPGDSAKAIAPHFVKIDAIERYLRSGTIPGQQEFISIKAVSGREARVGIAVDKSTGTAVTSQLYAAEHSRLRGAERLHRFMFGCEASLLRSLDGGQVDVVVPLGGEGRSARVRGPVGQPRSPGNITGTIVALDAGHIGLRIVALTPIPVSTDIAWGMDLGLAPSLAGSMVIGAVHDRPASTGFIPRVDHATGRIRIIRAFPAGSTWFLKVPAAKGQAKNAVEAIVASADHDRLAPADLALCGFGRFAAGKI